MRVVFLIVIMTALSGCELHNRLFSWGEQKPVVSKEKMSAELKNKKGRTAFIADIDIRKEKIAIRRVVLPAASDKSYELWVIHPKKKKPRSLGVVDSNTEIAAARLGKLEQSWLENTTLAVSLEPRGGSPTGEVTGPVLFTGKIKKVQL